MTELYRLRKECLAAHWRFWALWTQSKRGEVRELHWPVWQARQAAREALYRVYEAKRG